MTHKYRIGKKNSNFKTMMLNSVSLSSIIGPPGTIANFGGLHLLTLSILQESLLLLSYRLRQRP